MGKKKNPNLVSAGKPKAGGAVFIAPAGTPVPTDAISELPEEFACLGCISEDGVTNAQSTDSEDFTDWEGEVVESSTTTYAETLGMTFIEVVNTDVLSFVYGADHVHMTERGGVHIEHTGDDRDECVLVVDTILKGKKIDRLVAPRATVGEIGDITRKRSELMGYEATIKCKADVDGVPVHEYIDSTEVAPGGVTDGEQHPEQTEGSGEE